MKVPTTVRTTMTRQIARKTAFCFFRSAGNQTPAPPAELRSSQPGRQEGDEIWRDDATEAPLV
jgi:hypothetical protein